MLTLSRRFVMAAQAERSSGPIATSMRRCVCARRVKRRIAFSRAARFAAPPSLLSPRATNPTPPAPRHHHHHHHNRKLEDALRPTSLTIINESHKHAGHSGNPTGAADAETHFRVEVVSAEFSGKRLVQRHQAVYRLLDDEIKAGVHALSMDTRTPEEVQGK
jgi:stress-induced morphogen